ncbi:MAG: hypothetical protein HQM14_07810 [SAR324 cluster bacterium]|nr:hypothetical protein [SAR324 cluster bacterium]
MTFVSRSKQRFFLWALYVVGMMILFGCSSESDDTAGIRIPNPQTEEESEEQIAISGIFAVAESYSTQQSRQLRVVEGSAIQLMTNTGGLLDRTTTTRQGSFQFQVQFSENDLPLTLQGKVGKQQYRSAIVSLADTITANINDITTSIHEEFIARGEHSEENFNRISELMMFNRFGANNEGNPNILPETFLTEDFSDPTSLGNLLLEAAGKSSKSLLSDAPEDESLLANHDFLQAFVTQFRGAGNPEALHPIKGSKGSDSLFEGLNDAFHAPDQMQMDSTLNQIREEVLQNGQQKKAKIQELKGKLE